MAALSGALDGIQLAPLVNFLAELRKTGHLAVSDGPWTGTIFLDHGRVVGATFGSERGIDALDAIGLALINGDFVFSEAAHDAAEELELTLMMSAVEVQTHLAELARESAALAEVIPSMSAVPRVVVQDSGDDRAEITLDRGTLGLLLSLESGGTVADVAARRGVIRTLRQMAQLVRLGLLSVDATRADIEHASRRSSAPPATNGRAVPVEPSRQDEVDRADAPKSDKWWRRGQS